MTVQTESPKHAVAIKELQKQRESLLRFAVGLEETASNLSGMARDKTQEALGARQSAEQIAQAIDTLRADERSVKVGEIHLETGLWTVASQVQEIGPSLQSELSRRLEQAQRARTC